MENNIFYIYVYLDPRKPGNFVYGKYQFDYEPFYVGKGSYNRYSAKHNKNKYCENIINEIKYFGMKHICEFTHKKLSENIAYDMEKKIIKTIGRLNLGLGPLTNKSDGGKLPINIIYTDEIKKKMCGENNPAKRLDVRQKISKANKGKPGRKLNLEERKKMSIMVLGEKNPFYGKKHKIESCKKMSESHKGKKHSEETKKKVSETLKGRSIKPHTEEAKKKMSESKRKIWLIITPTGDEIIVNNMKDFCSENNLLYYSIKRYKTKKYYTLKKYKCKVIGG